MLNALMAVILPIVVLLVLTIVFLVLMAPRGAFIGAVFIYLMFGLFIASAQFSGGGECPSWRVDGYWWPIVDWPGDIYQNVWAGEVSMRQYLIPRTCELEGNLPGNG